MISFDVLPVPPLNKLKVGQRVAMAGGLVGTLLKKDARPQMLEVLVEGCSTGAAWYPYAYLTGILQVIDPFDQIHPMLAKTVKDQAAIQKLIDNPLWWFEEKFDGERQMLAFGSGVALRATTRVQGKDSGRLGDSTQTLRHFWELPVPDGGATVFDCELTHPHGFAALRSIMGSDTQLALEKQRKIGPVEAKIFDVLWLGGRDLRGLGHAERRNALTAWYHEVDGWAKKQHSTTEYWPYVHLSKIANGAPDKQAMLESVLAAGGEGVMAKHAHGVYTNTTLPDQRSKHIIKIKPFTSDEFIIVGFENGKGQYNQDKFGAVKLAQWVPDKDWPVEGEGCSAQTVGTVQTVGGSPTSEPMRLLDCGTSNIGTAAMEAAFRGDPDSFIGTVIEVKYQQRWPKTLALRHPSLLRFRPDKPAWSGRRRKGGSVRS